MNFRFITLSTCFYAALTADCPTVPAGDSICSICGPGKCIQNPNNPISFPGGFGPFSCEQLQGFGFSGFVPMNFCSSLPALVESECGCATSLPDATPPPTPPLTALPTGEPTFPPTSPPTSPPTLAPTPTPPTLAPTTLPPTPPPTPPPSNAPVAPTDTACVEADHPDPCWVCGDPALIPANGATLFSVPGFMEVDCDTIAFAGRQGFITEEQCTAALVEEVNTICGCQPCEDVPTASPTIPDDGIPTCPNANGPDPCFVCGSPSLVVVNKNTQFLIAGFPATSCDNLAFLGRQGYITPLQCTADLVDEVEEVCGCTPCESAVITSAPTRLPTAMPTNPPTDIPTNDPTNRPTNVPTDAPTPIPITSAPTRRPTLSPTSPPTGAPVPPTPAPLLIFTPAPLPPVPAIERTFAPVRLAGGMEGMGMGGMGGMGGMNKGSTKAKLAKDKTRRLSSVTPTGTGIRG